MTWYIKSANAVPGDDVKIDIIAENPVALKSLSEIGFRCDSPIQPIGMSERCEVYNGAITTSISGDTMMFAINGSNPSAGSNFGVIFSAYFHVPENCPAGKYYINWISSDMNSETTSGSAYFPLLREGSITVGSGPSTGTTTTTTTTSTTTTTTTTSTTTTTTTTSTTTTTTTTTTTSSVTTTVSSTISTTPTTTAPPDAKFSARIDIVSLPNKLHYTVGEPLDLRGAAVNTYQTYFGEWVLVDQNEAPADYPDKYHISGFDSSYAHQCKVTVTYRVYNNVLNEWVTADSSFYVDISSDTTTTTTTTTTSTTTTTVTSTSSSSSSTTTTAPPNKPYVILEQPEASQLYAGNSVNLNYHYSDSSAFSGNVWFESDNWNVAGVSDNKVLNINSAGTAVITINAMLTDGSVVKTSITINATAQPVQKDYILGDVNGDQKVDASDATLVLREYTILLSNGASTLTEAQKLAANADGSNNIDASDATLILRYYTLSLSNLTGTMPSFEEWVKNSL